MDSYAGVSRLFAAVCHPNSGGRDSGWRLVGHAQHQATNPSIRTHLECSASRARSSSAERASDPAAATCGPGPIDAVYTWVDGSDPVWQERKRAALQRLGLPASSPSNRANRFANHDELRYSLRALETNMPWIRHIHILTDGQRPTWLNTDHPRIRLTDHRAFFRDAGHLPCFNSLAIEANLRLVPGLAEHFIYFNDDMLINRPLGAETFFAADGRPRLFVFPKLSYALEHAASRFAAPLVRWIQRYQATWWLRHKASRRPPFSAALRHTQLVLLQRSDHPIRRFKTHHTPIPLTLSLLDSIERAYPAEYAATSSHAFRSAQDLYFPDLYATHGITAGLALPSWRRRSELLYFHLGRDDVRDLLTVGPGSHTFVNIDDASEHTSSDSSTLSAALHRLFPTPAPFEHVDPSVNPGSGDFSSRAG
ncbi:MAG: Stealth CR1 domain-containing protein [Opitutaceae bacterium]|nr:Stealth CR1 domain-containing protein [Opitutaceae bacterium]